MRTPVLKNPAELAAALRRAHVLKTKAAVAIRHAGSSVDEEINGFALLHGELHVHRRSDRTFLIVTADDQLIEADSPSDLVKP